MDKVSGLVPCGYLRLISDHIGDGGSEGDMLHNYFF